MRAARHRALTIAAGLALLASAGVAAGDGGRGEINQAAALAGGVTPGDAPGFPVTIDTPGSYVLTGNLDVPAGTGGMLVFADHVTLDLAGFAVRGPGSCSGVGSGISCALSEGTADGIRIGGDDIAVKNGAVGGFDRDGLNGLFDLPLEGIVLRAVFSTENTGFGADFFDIVGGRIEDSDFSRNGFIGLRVGAQTDVVDSRSTGNRIHGFHTNGRPGAVLRRCVARLNGLDGFSTNGPDTVLWNNASMDNENFGIDAAPVMVIGNSIVTGNGSGTINGTIAEIAGNFCEDGTACP